MRTIIFVLSLLLCGHAQAQVQDMDGYMPSQYTPEYLTADRTAYDKSVIYVFFNNDPCYTCADAISIIEQAYNQNFIDEYNMFIINYQNDNENNFIKTYNLYRPLEVVLARYDDGVQFGYRKLENLQTMTSDPTSLANYFIAEVEGFFYN